ncbi:DUF1858 domain-containing protein [candidate division KSB1 bacterium]|nr:DUF1858 domain-containing protein [candidate division KSB1 bacterium]
MKIHQDIAIEDLVREYPKSVGFLMEKGIRCLACGEPMWGTLKSAAEEKGFTAEQIHTLVEELEKRMQDV